MDNCPKHGRVVCEPCAYERGFRKALEIARVQKPEDVIERLEEHLQENGMLTEKE